MIPSDPEALVSLEAFMALDVFKPVIALPQASGPFVEALKILRSVERSISFCASGNGVRVWAGRWGMGSAGWAWGLQGGRRDCKVGVRPIPGAQKIMPRFCFQFFEVLRVFQSSSPELRSMSGRKESFWDGLGPEIYGARPRILARAEYSARAQHTFRSFHINPTWNQ